MITSSNEYFGLRTEAREFRYLLIDVFAEQPFTGVPLAVFLDARGLLPKTMQRIAHELNRAQTAFVLPSNDGSPPRVRVFTAHEEVPYCRSPALGTAFALELETRRPPPLSTRRMLLESENGAVSVSSLAQVLTIRKPIPELGAVYPDEDAAYATLGLSPSAALPGMPVRSASSGTPFLIIPLRNRDALKEIRLRRDIWERTIRQFEASRLLAFTLEAERATATAEMRVFAPDMEPAEESATEAACGPLAAYLVHYGLVSAESPQRMLFEQGAEVDRPSYLHALVERDATQVTSVRVGGQCLCVGEGRLRARVEGLAS